MMDTGAWELRFEFSDVKAERVTDTVAVIAFKVREELTVYGKQLTLETTASAWCATARSGPASCSRDSVLGHPYGRDRKPMAKKVAA